MTEHDLTLTTTCITTLAAQPDATEKIQMLLRALFSAQEKSADFLAQNTEKRKNVSSVILFPQKELSEMDKTFKKEFIANGLAAHVIKRNRGKNAVIYEIRYRRNGFDIRAASANLDEAKRKFIKQASQDEIEKHRKNHSLAVKNSFRSLTEEWLDFRKDKLNPRTHKNYQSYAARYLFPVLGGLKIEQIKSIDINKIMADVDGRVYEDLRVILNSVFKYALANGLIQYNPMLLIPFKKAERNCRRALNTDELKKLFANLNLPEYVDYKRTFLILLFFGLRPCELEDAHFEGDFLIARNAKRKNGKIEYKKIPVCRQARELIDLSAPVQALHRTDVLNRIFKRIMGDENVTQYFLRHTFATICQQYVRPDIVDIWMGDSSERLVGRVYTHFSDKFMTEQMNNVFFDL